MLETSCKAQYISFVGQVLKCLTSKIPLRSCLNCQSNVLFFSTRTLFLPAWLRKPRLCDASIYQMPLSYLRIFHLIHYDHLYLILQWGGCNWQECPLLQMRNSDSHGVLPGYEIIHKANLVIFFFTFQSFTMKISKNAQTAETSIINFTLASLNLNNY